MKYNKKIIVIVLAHNAATKLVFFPGENQPALVSQGKSSDRPAAGLFRLLKALIECYNFLT